MATNTTLGFFIMFVGGMAGIGPLHAVAAESGGAPTTGVLEEIVITARKQSETILDVPLSVQAFTNEDIKAAGITNLESLAMMTPNLDFQNLGNSQPGRWNSAIRFRGMETQITTPTNQTGGFFVDGINVLGGASSVAFSDIARVEVIRGPQPVYFGRGTFGGAINYVTVDPAEQFGGQFTASYSPRYGSNDYSLYLEGGLADGLTARLTGFAQTTGGAFTASDGGELGKEITQGASLIVKYTPNDQLNIKARVAYSQDDDGPAATTFIPFRTYSNTPVGTPITVPTTGGALATTFAKAWWQGGLPVTPVDLNSHFYNFEAVDGQVYNVGTLLFDSIAADGGSLPGPDLDHLGLRTDMLVSSLAIDYKLNDAVTVSGLFGYNDRKTAAIRDADLYSATAWVVASGLDLESWSAEGRVRYDNGGPLRLLAGINYAKIDQFGSIDGGYSVFNGYFGTLAVGRLASNAPTTVIETVGLFGSAEYDILDWLTASVELRYQADKSKDASGWYDGTRGPFSSQTFYDLLPRYILSARPWDGTNIYASYSEGTLPGGRNTGLDNKTPEERAEIASLYGISENIRKEELKAYEIGWKQSLPGGNLWFSADAFYQEWDGMKSSVTYAYVPTVVPNNGNAFLSGVVAGSSTQTGVELELRWQATDNLALQGSYGYVKSEYDHFLGSSMNSVLGLPPGTNFVADGKVLPRSPESSAALSATWSAHLVNDWNYSARGDVIYKGKTYTDELNVTSISDYTLMNLRAEIQRDDGLTLGIYCANCADEDGWATGRRLTDFGQIPNFFASQGAVVDPIRPREVGVSIGYKF